MVAPPYWRHTECLAHGRRDQNVGRMPTREVLGPRNEGRRLARRRELLVVLLWGRFQCPSAHAPVPAVLGPVSRPIARSSGAAAASSVLVGSPNRSNVIRDHLVTPPAFTD